MNYKFKEVRLNLERNTIDVVVAFKISKNQWQLKHYKYPSPNGVDVDIDELLKETKRVIEE